MCISGDDQVIRKRTRHVGKRQAGGRIEKSADVLIVFLYNDSLSPSRMRPSASITA